MYFGRAKAACLCSYCGNRHLCYDGGGLGRVKKVTPRVGAREKEGKRGCPFLPSFSLRASSPIWASETSLARTRERAAKPRGAEERPLASLAQIGELARRLPLFSSFNMRFRQQNIRAPEENACTAGYDK